MNNEDRKTGVVLNDAGNEFVDVEGFFSLDKKTYTTTKVVPADPNDENSVETTVKTEWSVEVEPPVISTDGGKKRRSSKKSKKGGKKSSKKSKKAKRSSKKSRKH